MGKLPVTRHISIMKRISNRLSQLWGPINQLKHVTPSDSASSVVSARKYCLFIFAIALLAIQLVSVEYERRRLSNTFFNIEKALRMASILQVNDVSPIEKVANTDPIIRYANAPLFQLVFAMVGTEKVTELKLENVDEQLATISDPTGSCKFGAFQIHTSNISKPGNLALKIIFHNGARDWKSVNPSTISLVEATDSCLRPPELLNPFAIVEYEQGKFGVIFSKAIYDLIFEDLGVGPIILDYTGWQTNPLKKANLQSHLTQSQLERLSQYDQPFLNVIDVKLLQAFVLRKANSISGQGYRLRDLDEAFGTIFQYTNSRDRYEKYLWILQISQVIAAKVIPIALLILCFLLLHRVKRIAPKDKNLSEAWIAIKPQGTIETIGAGIWILALIAAWIAITWSVWVFGRNGWMLIATYWQFLLTFFSYEPIQYFYLLVSSVIKSFLFWGLTANLVSLVLLLRACQYIFVQMRRQT